MPTILKDYNFNRINNNKNSAHFCLNDIFTLHSELTLKTLK